MNAQRVEKTEALSNSGLPSFVIPAVSNPASKSKEAYQIFLQEVESRFLNHRIVVDNRYTRWFQHGNADLEELRHFTVQFSVFSNQFLIAQLKKMINAESLESMRAAKEILANEIGVIFNNKQQRLQEGADTDIEGDPELTSMTGSVDGGTFRFKAAHFEWLLKFAEPLGLAFHELGKRRHGTAGTLHFCDELERIYGSEDPNIAAGASFAIENWAAAGFWQELEDGLIKIKQSWLPELSIAFFAWHNRLEAQHAQHTHDELEELFQEPWFDQAKFLQGGFEMLEGLAALWDGLYEDHLKRQK